MVLTMADSLSGARMKLQRAEEHFGQLRFEFGQFIERNPYRMLREDDLRQGQNHFLWRAKIVEHPPYEKWASLVGECIHALRAALDQTAYALVNRETLVSEKCGFPILDKPGSWDSAYPKDLPGVPPEALTLMEQLQPYNGTVKTNALWAVHQLDIIDKHRRLSLVNTTIEGTRWSAAGCEVITSDSGVGPFVDGAVVGRFRLVPKPGEDMHMQTDFAFGIAMGEGEPLEGEPVVPALEVLRSNVGGVVALFADFL
jgi:hypothetical protein